jgi:hypothetical protein
MENSDWKDFLLKYKWMPSRHLMDKFEIQRYDITNFTKNPEVRAVIRPWRISAKQSPDRLFAILTDAWEYYITQVKHIDVNDSPRNWVPELIRLRSVSRKSRLDEDDGLLSFTFLTDSRYLKTACPAEYEQYRALGLTNICLATHEFWPGRQHLAQAGVLPFMFQETHRSALEQYDPESMVEHVYLNFLADDNAMSSDQCLMEAKERFYARHKEQAFVTGAKLARFGVPQNFYQKEGGLRNILKKIAHKYALELGYLTDVDARWSSSEFRKRFPDRHVDTCEYCGLRPVDLHHLLRREDYPNLVYESDNVVPICVQVHQYITRGHWTEREAEAYEAAEKDWLRAKEHEVRRERFRDVMDAIHGKVYGPSSTTLQRSDRHRSGSSM